MGDDMTPGPVQVPVTVALRVFIITDDAGNGQFRRQLGRRLGRGHRLLGSWPNLVAGVLAAALARATATDPESDRDHGRTVPG